MGPTVGVTLADGRPRTQVGVSLSVAQEESGLWGLFIPTGSLGLGKGFSLGASVPLAVSLEAVGVAPTGGLANSVVTFHHLALNRGGFGLSWGFAQWLPATRAGLGLGEGQLGSALRAALRYSRGALSVLGSVAARVEYGREGALSLLVEALATGRIGTWMELGLGFELAPRWSLGSVHPVKPEWRVGVLPFVGLRLGERVSLHITGSIPVIEGGPISATSGVAVTLGRLPEEDSRCSESVCSCSDEEETGSQEDDCDHSDP